MKKGSYEGFDQTDIEAGGVRLFTSLEERNAYVMGEIIATAINAGYDTTQREVTGSMLCGKHGTAELVEVYPDGTWQYRDETNEDFPVKRSGRGAQRLNWYLEKTPDERLEVYEP